MNDIFLEISQWVFKQIFLISPVNNWFQSSFVIHKYSLYKNVLMDLDIWEMKIF